MSSVKTSLGMPDIFDFMWKDFDRFFNDYSSQNSYVGSNYVYKDINYPPMNVWANHDTKDLVIEFAVAGIPMKNIEIKVEGDDLELSIERRESEREGFKLIRKGIKCGKVKQKIYIPASKYKIDLISAVLKDGVLLIEVPAKDEIKPRKVLIEHLE